MLHWHCVLVPRAHQEKMTWRSPRTQRGSTPVALAVVGFEVVPVLVHMECECERLPGSGSLVERAAPAHSSSATAARASERASARPHLESCTCAAPARGFRKKCYHVCPPTHAFSGLVGVCLAERALQRTTDRTPGESVKVVRSHSLGEFWKSALHKSMSAKATGAGEERMDNDGAKQ